MKFTRLIIPFVACCLLASTVKAQDLDLYLLIGQSNMAGRGPVIDTFKTEGNDSVLMFTKEMTWVKAMHPLHFDKPSVSGVGPGLRFGIEMQRATHHRIGLIPCAVGGTSINSWKEGGYDKPTNTHPYDDAIVRIKEAMKSGTLKGVIWLQGESDSNPDKAKGYLEKLKALIKSLRTVAGNKKLPFVAGQIAQYKPQNININRQIDSLPSVMKFTAVAPSFGLKDKGDGIHFNSPDADEFGRRFATAMLSITDKKKKKKHD